MMKRSSYLLALLFFFSSCFAQSNIKQTEQDQAYTKVINERAAKIVATLGITDASKASQVQDIIATRYRQLNDIQSKRDEKIKAAKAQSANNKETIAAQVKSYEDAANTEIELSHKEYLSALSKELTPQQVDQVKDGMTYNVLPITYKGYLEMIPELTNKQKDQIKIWLTEAREHAIDAGTSEKKHWWFGKYKGRINNYLSAEGYDLKKAGEDWEKRRNAAKNVSNNQ